MRRADVVQIAVLLREGVVDIQLRQLDAGTERELSELRIAAARVESILESVLESCRHVEAGEAEIDLRRFAATFESKDTVHGRSDGMILAEGEAIRAAELKARNDELLMAGLPRYERLRRVLQ